MKIQVLKNETYQSVDDLPKKGTNRATGFDVIVTSGPEIIGETYDNGAYKRVDYIQYKTNLKLAVQKEIHYRCFLSLMSMVSLHKVLKVLNKKGTSLKYFKSTTSLM